MSCHQIIPLKFNRISRDVDLYPLIKYPGKQTHLKHL